MVDRFYKPFRARHGDRVTHKLQPGEDPTMIAKRLTLKIYLMVRGDGANIHRRLVYPVSGWLDVKVPRVSSRRSSRVQICP